MTDGPKGRFQIRSAIFAGGRFVSRFLPRAYALSLLMIIAWLTWMAISYLVTSLVYASVAPPQVTGVPTRLEPSILTTERSQWRGIEAAENPRGPLAHYHRLDSWIQPDRFNDCSRSGCHAPLPHSRRREVRAFLNMHATSIHCGVCHMESQSRSTSGPLALTWYDLRTGAASEAPSVLQAYEMLTLAQNELAKGGEPAQQRATRLLRNAASEAQALPALQQLAEHFAAVRPGSDASRRLVAEARDILPRHFRGEYGAKLALRDPASGRPILAHPNTAEAVARFLTESKFASEERRKELLAGVHPVKREKPLVCTDCHRLSGSLIDFAKLGYPPARVEGLTQPIIFRMIEHINTGQPMHLPEIVGSPVSSPRPTTAPAS